MPLKSLLPRFCHALNSFYCSCERVFNPSLQTRPVIVLSNNDSCVISRTNEAKALNIPMGAPEHEIKYIIEKNDVAVFSSNYALYGDMSARVMNILEQFACITLNCKLMTIKEFTELQKRGVDADFRRRFVSAYELGFITVEQVVNDLKISRSLLRRWCRWYYLLRLM